MTDRVILLVEKNGDASYTATGSGTKRDTYLGFVVEAESHIVREVGYFEWLRRSGRIYLADGVDTYELPSDVGQLAFIRPSWNDTPLAELTDFMFHNRLGRVQQSGGRPQVYRLAGPDLDDRSRITVYPTPSLDGVAISEDNDHLIVEYFARPIYPAEPDVEIPTIPQDHMDVLIYGAAAHALMLDTDSENAQLFAQTFASKLGQLRRDAHRKVSERQTVMRSAADVFRPDARGRPLLRASQLGVAPFYL